MRVLVSIGLLFGVFALIGCGNVKATPDAGADAAPDSGVGCTANTFTCGADNALYECDAEGAALTKVQDCQYGCSVDRCNECEANTTFCSGNDLVMCDASGKIVNPQSCQYGCQMDRCNTCEPNVAYCDGATAVTCGANGEPAAMVNCGNSGCAGGVCNSCTPNTTSCQGDTLVVCNGQGMVQSTTSCALGCANTPSAHCRALVPSYGVGAPSGTLPNLVVNADATLNISNCSASPSSVDLTIGMSSMSIVGFPQISVVNQTNGPPICVVRFGSINVGSGFTLTVVNSASPGHVLSLQAVGDIQIEGTIAFTNAASGPSPGGAASVFGTNANGDHRAPGAGGAGAARAGGTGGAYDPDSGAIDYAGGTGGAAVTTIATQLTGGSAGGNVMDGTTIIASGGAGGGGLQLVSLTRVTLTATGRINLNAQGGWGAGTLKNGNLPGGGGGSGGTLVVEAPIVKISAGSIAAANGGGGAGGCYSCSGSGPLFLCTHHNGEFGQLSATRAAGGDCPGYGDGGYEANGATSPTIHGAPSDQGAVTAAGGSGGGSSGFIILRGRAAASVMIAGGAIVSPMPTVGAVTAN